MLQREAENSGKVAPFPMEHRRYNGDAELQSAAAAKWDINERATVGRRVTAFKRFLDIYRLLLARYAIGLASSRTSRPVAKRHRQSPLFARLSTGRETPRCVMRKKWGKRGGYLEGQFIDPRCCLSAQKFIMGRG